jgi:extracellular factor (EF) 3-hydroxypalmitic acid methyl ester biosynthesis protein
MKRTAKRLRSSRYRPSDFRLGSLRATFEHCSTPAGEGEVVDFSGQGIALAVDDTAGIFLSGDSLPYLRVFRGRETFYDGPAVVRHVREEKGRLVLGLAFQGAWMDLGKLYQVDLRLDLEERFGAFFEGLAALDRIDPRFKAWVADVQYLLEELRSRLDEEEKRIANLDLLTREATARETVDLVTCALRSHMEARIAELNEIVAGFDEPLHQIHRLYFQRHLKELFLTSPFAQRCLHKPLGYAGDYEVMNMLYRDHREGASLFGRVVNAFSCSLSAARANINRVQYLRGRLAGILRERPCAAIASIGCGPAQEIRDLIAQHPEVNGASVTLLDIEPMAIQYCEKVLLSDLVRSGRNVQVQFIRESVRELIRQERLDEVLEPQDVVVSAGLFDYFGDKMFQRLLTRLYGLLRPGGHLFIGNVNVNNDSRVLMEYMAEWYLHHRSPADLRALARVLPDGAEVQVQAEPLGVNLFLQISKRAEARVEEDVPLREAVG